MLVALLVALFIIGLGFRAAPFLDVDGRLMAQWPTEDGYFMLAIGRSLAMGHGFAVGLGEIPTNGTQPLVTFIWALAFLLAGGSREGGVAITLVIQLLVGLATAFGIYRLGLRALRGRADAERISKLAALVWFATPLAIGHSMNGLETGFYGLVAVAVAYVFTEPEASAKTPWGVARALAVGVLLGVAFWVRNDAVFLILAACLTYLFTGLHLGLQAVKTRFFRTLVFGATSVVVASPWLAYNYVKFGHIMPVSGRAESLTREFAENLIDLTPTLVEYAGVIVPVPHRLSQMPPVAAACGVLVLILLAFIPALWRRADRVQRTLIVLVGIYGACLATFYGLFFGAGWFMARYLYPLSPFLTLLWTAVMFAAWSFLRERRLAPLGVAAVGVMLAMVVGLNARVYKQGKDHPHFQVARWVQENVPEEYWVGAVQTGTLGFFHDRTVNLDGKVNIQAYHAQAEKRIGRYVVSTPIEYLVDWEGMATWLEMPLLDAHFKLLVHDKEANLGVLRRKDGVPRPEEQAAGVDEAELALKLHTRSEELATALVAAEPERLEPRLALWASRLGLGRAHLATSRAREGLLAFEAALEVARELVALDANEATQDALAVTLGAMGDLTRALGELERAETLHTEALELRRAMLNAEPFDVSRRRDLAAAEERLAEVYRVRGELGLAEKALEGALELRQRLAGASPRSRGLQLELSMTQVELGDLALQAGRAEDARALFAEAHRIRERLAKSDPSDARAADALALTHGRLATVARAAGEDEAARGHVERMVALRGRLHDPVRRDARELLARSLELGGAIIGAGAERREASARQARALLASGERARAAGRLSDAEPRYAEALHILERLAEGAPGESEEQSDRALLHLRLGEVNRAAGRFEEARASFEAAVEIAATAPRAGRFDETLLFAANQLMLMAEEARDRLALERFLDAQERALGRLGPSADDARVEAVRTQVKQYRQRPPL